MAARKKGDDPQHLLQALRHPLRRDLLRLATERGELSPIRAAREVERPVSVVSYHLRELAKEGALALDGDAPGSPLEQVYVAESVKTAYDRFAPVYDEANAQNDYEMWLGEVLLPELEKRGLQKGWALDVGCGTGRAFEPLIARGWHLVGCDLSAGMLAEAARKFGSTIQLFELDARDLPPISPDPGLPEGNAFDLVLLLNDVINYLTEPQDLELVFSGVERNLNRDHGLLLFDANTLGLLRDNFALGLTEELSEEGFEWSGLSERAEPEGVYEARLSGRGVESHMHRQRHWPVEQVTAALEASGLRCLAALGQREEDGRVMLSDEPDEERDSKVVYVAAPAGAARA